MKPKKTMKDIILDELTDIDNYAHENWSVDDTALKLAMVLKDMGYIHKSEMENIVKNAEDILDMFSMDMNSKEIWSWREKIREGL